MLLGARRPRPHALPRALCAPPACGRRSASQALSAAAPGILAALLLATGAAAAEPDGSSGDVATRAWDALQSKLAVAGITPHLGYATDLQGNVRGGERRGFAYAGVAIASLELDLGTLVGLDGARFVVEGAWNSGRDLSETRIGNLLPVSQVFNGQAVRLGRLYLAQRLLEGRLALSLGRFTPEIGIFSPEVFQHYVSSAINPYPHGIEGNVPGFAVPPLAQWGIASVFTPVAAWRFGVGLFADDPSTFEDEDHGVDFALHPRDGLLAVAGVRHAHRLGAGDAGLPGEVRLGGYYSSRDHPDLRGSGTNGQNYGFFLAVEQRVFEESRSADEGLTPWLAFVCNPRQSINQVPLFAALGLVYHGLLPGRHDDVTVVGVFHGVVSSAVDDASAETAIELGHSFQLMPWLSLQPDLQWILQPGGRSTTSSALVLGAEIAIAF